MNKPTEKEITRFWEHFRVLKHEWTNEVGGYRITDCICEVCGISDWPPDNESSPCLPPINLETLYEYVVPKLQDKGHQVELLAFEHKGFRATVYDECFSQRGSDGYDSYLNPTSQQDNDNPTLALFWAIYHIIEDTPNG